MDGTSATPECDAGNPVRLFLKTSDRGSWQETQDEETQSGKDLVSSAQRCRKRVNLSSFPDHIYRNRVYRERIDRNKCSKEFN